MRADYGNAYGIREQKCMNDCIKLHMKEQRHVYTERKRHMKTKKLVLGSINFFH